jgi:penicillin-binding protein 1A
MAGSVNCAFLRLGTVVGLDKVIAQAHKMGVTATLNPNLSLPLGTDPISPLEMAGAYAAIANDGIYNAPYFIEKIEAADGRVIYEHKRGGERVMSQQTARQATVAMQAVVTGGTATRAQLSGRQAAGKTGTTEKHGDAWFVGFTPQLTTAVWMGSPEAQVPMNSVGGINVYGGTFPALIWHNFMTDALDGMPSMDFTAPAPMRVGKFLQPPKGKETFGGSGSGFTPTSSAGGGGATGTTARSGVFGPSTTAPATTEPPPPTTAGPPANQPGGGGGP